MSFTLSSVIFIVVITLNTVICDFNVVSTTQQPNRQNLADMIVNNTRRLNELESEKTQVFIKTLESINQNIAKMQKNFEKVTHDGYSSKSDYPISCNDIKENGINQSGIYIIKPKPSSKPFAVFCDMDVHGGGWIYFLHRYDGSQDFYLNWDDYKNGFGSLTAEFWLGLEYLHQITNSEINELLVELTDHDGNTAYALYDAFVVGSEQEGYSMKALGKHSGNAGDSLRHQSGMKFTTKDRDQDRRPHNNCAVDEHGGYWYNVCTDSNLTSRYLRTATQEGYRYAIMYWNNFRGSAYSLKKAKMMVRPRKTVNTVMNK